VLENAKLDREQVSYIVLSVTAYDCPNTPAERRTNYTTVSFYSMVKWFSSLVEYHFRAMEHHLPYGITRYLPLDAFECTSLSPPARQAGT